MQSELILIREAIQDLKDAIAEMNRYRFADQYLTPAELAKLLGVSRNTVMNWRKEGILPYACFGKKVFFRLRDIEVAFDSQFKTARSKPKKPKPLSRPKIKSRYGNGFDLKVKGDYREYSAAR
jgi:excisionase family DNA binding protein